MNQVFKLICAVLLLVLFVYVGYHLWSIIVIIYSKYVLMKIVNKLSDKLKMKFVEKTINYFMYNIKLFIITM